MINKLESPFKKGDVIKITAWTSPKPLLKTTLVKIERVVLPTLVLVEYVKIKIDEKVEVGEGRLNPTEILTWELISEEQFNCTRNVVKPQ